MERGILLCLANDPYNFGHVPYTSALRGTEFNIAIADYDQAFSFNFDTVLAVILDSDSESYGAKKLAAHIKQWFPRVPVIMVAECESVAHDAVLFIDGAIVKDFIRRDLLPELRRVNVQRSWSNMRNKEVARYRDSADRYLVAC